MSNNELWRDIKFVNNGKEYDYTRLYQISSKGRVKQLAYTDAKGRKRKEKIMKTTIDRGGYEFIGLTKNYKRNYFSIHRLVALCFIPNPNNLPQVNHIDENKLNNTIGNLEWCTSEYNNNHGTRNERMVATNKANGTYDKMAATKKAKGTYEKIADKCSKPIYCITNNTVYKSAHEAARQLNLNQSSVSKCCKCKRKSTKGYQFRYHN